MAQTLTASDLSAEKLDAIAMTNVSRACLPKQDSEPSFIMKIDFNFSYRKRTKHSQAYLDAKEELRQLERMKRKKNIGNILETLLAVYSQQPSLTYKNLRRLGFVLACQTPNISFSLSQQKQELKQLDDENDDDFDLENLEEGAR